MGKSPVPMGFMCTPSLRSFSRALSPRRVYEPTRRVPLQNVVTTSAKATWRSKICLFPGAHQFLLIICIVICVS